jgi:hypothetical protein
MSSPWAVIRRYELSVLELSQALRLTLAQSTDAACCLMASLPKTGVGRGLPDRNCQKSLAKGRRTATYWLLMLS